MTTTVFFDLDGTLLPQPSSERRFMVYLLRHRVAGPRQMLAATLFLARWLPVYGRNVHRVNKAYLSGLPVDEVTRLAKRFVVEELLPALDAGVLERLKAHQGAGDRVILLSGTLQGIADALADQLGTDESCATTCHTQDGRFTAKPPIRHPFGKAKLDLARLLCREARISLDTTTAYADSASDLPLLEAVGRAVAVAPDRRLRRIAASRGWEIVEHRPTRRLPASGLRAAR